MSETRIKLLADIERYLAEKNIPATNFGQDLFKDRHMVSRLRAGKGITLDRYDVIRAKINPVIAMLDEAKENE